MEYPTNGQREHGGNVNLHSSLQTASDPMKDCYSNDIESPEIDCTIKEELLKCIPLKGQTTGQNLFSSFENIISSEKIPISKMVVLTTDGAPAMRFSLRLRFICDRLYYKYKVLKRLFNTISKIIFNNTYFYSYMFLLPNERDHVTTPTKYRYKGFDVTYQVVIKKDGNIFNITINATL
ncbi:unnamed protein product [Acanthoscelides obtectus]|uniref:Uncharacterized protein n=1 Tax=Acanthoscelides obtectus TaxID=200917 RepID=A0A9P0LCE2_ACAOB|nr:unnamed protein product [Acanthoscelides obtectus]CAK1649733.1 hypothetical protein AOBTE_LOCUS16389 [Acanthoscelides obtectus]